MMLKSKESKAIRKGSIFRSCIALNVGAVQEQQELKNNYRGNPEGWKSHVARSQWLGIASSEISELRLLSSSDTSASSLTRDMGLLPLVVTM
ncbi:hypothetical protein CUMW_116520 [Citrus unshiu]|nr:hypothetical protein CUMW_116520 [Citrus unshiu]